MYEYNMTYPNELYHYGVKGMKWGKRKAHVTLGNRYHSRAARSVQRDADNLRKHGYKSEADAVQLVADKHRQKAAESQRKADSKQPMSTKKKVAIVVGVGAAVAATALAAYGGYKYSSIKKQNLALGKYKADSVLKMYKTIGDEFTGLGKRAAMLNETKKQNFSTAYKNVKEANANLNRNFEYYGPSVTRYKGKIHYNGTAGF